MAKSEQQRQKQLAKKRAKANQKQRQVNQRKQQLSSLAGQCMAASRGEIVLCGMSEGASTENSEFGTGLGTVLFARRMPDGHIALAFFLVDRFCLGVKDTGCRMCSRSELDVIVERFSSSLPLASVEPHRAKRYIDGAIEYAAGLGFSPHPDYRKIAPIWGDIDGSQSDAIFEFGKDGRPCYIVGPNDDSARQRLIFNRLYESVGEGNFDWVLISDFGDNDGLYQNFLTDDDDDDGYLRIDGPNSPRDVP